MNKMQAIDRNTEACRFLSEWGDSFNLGVDSVEPESNKCPPDTCIEIFESPIQKRPGDGASHLLVFG